MISLIVIADSRIWKVTGMSSNPKPFGRRMSAKTRRQDVL